MQRLQLGEDLLPVGRRNAGASSIAGGHADRRRLLDAKDLALDRHLLARPLAPQSKGSALNVRFIALRNAQTETID